jgi:hypothetical protein
MAAAVAKLKTNVGPKPDAQSGMVHVFKLP